MRLVILGSGSKGNSTFIDTGNKKILIDVGFSFKQMKERLEKINVYPKEIDYLLITHDHSDHINGLASFLKNTKPLLIISKKIYDAYADKLNYNNIHFIEDEMIFDDLFIKSIPTSHDSIDAHGYLIEFDNTSIVQITDTGYIHKNNLIYLKNKNYYLMESNHDTEMLINGKYPLYLQQRILSDKGHMSNELSSGYLSRLIGENTKAIVLMHLSEENNTPEIALDTIKNNFKDNNIIFDNIKCAPQHDVLEVK